MLQHEKLRTFPQLNVTLRLNLMMVYIPEPLSFFIKYKATVNSASINLRLGYILVMTSVSYHALRRNSECCHYCDVLHIYVEKLKFVCELKNCLFLEVLYSA